MVNEKADTLMLSKEFFGSIQSLTKDEIKTLAKLLVENDNTKKLAEVLERKT